MAVLLRMSYAGYLDGTTVELPLNVETALIAQGMATKAIVANVTPGNVTANVQQGCAAIPAGASFVTINNSQITPNSIVMAVVSQAAADATLLRVERIVCLSGVFVIYGTASATAATLVDWAIVNSPGMTTTT